MADADKRRRIGGRTPLQADASCKAEPSVLEDEATSSASKPSTTPLEISVFTLGGSLCCSLRVTLATRVAEAKVMIQQSTGIPPEQQDLVVEGAVAAMDDRVRLYHYADALYGSRTMHLIQKAPRPLEIDHVTMNRLRKELERIPNDKALRGCKLAPIGGNFDISPLHWTASISGPVGGPYEGGVFMVDISIPSNYPYAPPRFSFITKVFHPLVASTGSIDLDLLHEKWSPALTLARVVCHLESLLECPYISDSERLECGNAEAIALSGDRSAFDVRARSWTEAHAMPPGRPDQAEP